MIRKKIFEKSSSYHLDSLGCKPTASYFARDFHFRPTLRVVVGGYFRNTVLNITTILGHGSFRFILLILKNYYLIKRGGYILYSLSSSSNNSGIFLKEIMTNAPQLGLITPHYKWWFRVRAGCKEKMISMNKNII